MMPATVEVMVKASSTCTTSRRAGSLLTGLESSRHDLLAQIFADLPVHGVRHRYLPYVANELIPVGGVGGHGLPHGLPVPVEGDPGISTHKPGLLVGVVAGQPLEAEMFCITHSSCARTSSAICR